MKMNKKSGTAIAATAAALLMAGAIAAPAVSAGDKAGVKCYGVNDCKGHGKCKTAMNECAGHNACKGKGWVKMSAEDCKTKGGSTEEAK
jgi:hypothetical protein